MLGTAILIAVAAVAAVLATAVYDASPLLVLAFLAATLGAGVGLAKWSYGRRQGLVTSLRRAGPTRLGLVLAWFAFVVMFGVLRAITFAIRSGVAFGDIQAGGVHLHHYLWGILILMIVAAAALFRTSASWRPWLGLAYGAACALVVDEFALLLHLEDVYWQREGRWSVDLALALAGTAGSLLVLTRTVREQDRIVASGTVTARRAGVHK